jgi:photosystem II stability/assembly factor-like uncharacterized protein
MKKNIFPYLRTLILLLIFSQAQNLYSSKHPFNLPASIPVPDWVNLADWDNPNVYKIDSLIYSMKSESKKKKDVIKNEMIKDFEEDPYMMAYIRWRNHMTPFIQMDGSIQYDENYYRNKLQYAINKQNPDKIGNSIQKSSGNWKPLGPIETFWQADQGESNEQVNIYQLAISPSKPSVIYCASETGVLFKSTDKGLSWVSISDDLPAIGVNSLAVDPTNENIVYCNANGYGLIKSTNGGSTWSILSSYNGRGGEKIEINPFTRRIFIIGDKNIYFSDNGGLFWTASTGSNINGYFYDLVLNPQNNDIIYAAAASSTNELIILKSTDSGINFKQITIGTSAIECSGAKLGVSPTNPNFVYCTSLGNKTGPKILKSTDMGNNWIVTASSKNTSLTGGGATTGLDMSNGQGWFDFDMMIDPKNANIIIVGTTTTYKSTDGGINFSPLGGYIGSFGLHPDLQCARVFGNDSYLATDGGVNYSTDFYSDLKNWSVRNRGLTGSEFWGFGQGWDEDIVVGGRYHNGNTAIFDKYKDGNSLALGGGEDATGHVFHGFERTVGYRDIGTYQIPESLKDKIKNAEIKNTLWPQDDYYGLFSSELVTDPRYSNTFYLGKDSILWKSSNSGSSYIALHNFGQGNRVWRFEISRSNYDYIYVCTNTGLFKSTDAGETWTKLSLPVNYSSYNSDIALNPLNENEVYLCMAGNPAGDKVIMSTNGGNSWKNITGKSLNNTKVSYLQYQGGTNGGIYAVTSNNYSATKVYYRDNSMSEWLDFSEGLKQNFFARNGGLIFYRDSKLRLAGSRGIWESPLYSKGSPIAQPMADKKYIACNKDTVRFFDYSMVDFSGAKWQWSFPGASWISDSNSRTPRVLYPKIGNYSVTLKVADSLGQSHSKTIEDMIRFTNDNCQPDTLVGKCVQMKGTSQVINLGKVGINSNTFSLSCWIKPNGLQNSFAQILSHYGCPGSVNYGLGLGFTFSGYTPNLMLCYTDDQVNYGNYSGLVCDSAQWNNVVLTYAPDGVKIYLNGIAAKVNNNKMPVLDLSLSPFYINADIHNQGGKFKGSIDEIKFYDYALSQEEVREKMHLIQSEPQSEKGLVKYYQFNNYEEISESVYDVINGFKSDIPIANINKSTAPVSTGKSFRKDVTTSGKHSFSSAGVDLFLPDGGIYPDGEVVAFHLNNQPDELPGAYKLVPGYFIINNFGKNTKFTIPDSITFSDLKIDVKYYNPGNFSLYNRNSRNFGKTWSNEIDSASQFIFNPAGSSLTWKSNSNISGIGQFAITSKNQVLSNVIEFGQNSSISELSEFYPNPANGFASINMNSLIDQEIGISINDINGISVYKITQEIKQGSNTILLILPKLAKGMYFGEVIFKNQRNIIRKLIVE